MGLVSSSREDWFVVTGKDWKSFVILNCLIKCPAETCLLLSLKPFPSLQGLVLGWEEERDREIPLSSSYLFKLMCLLFCWKFEMSHSGAAVVEVSKDKNGIDQVLLQNPRGASARVSRLFHLSIYLGSLHAFWCCHLNSIQVSLHGGQVLSWRSERGEELLFISSKVTIFEVFIVTPSLCNLYFIFVT